MLNKFLIIGAGGFFGSILRYVVSGFVQKFTPNSLFPWGTLVVNASGCLVIGILFGVSENTRIFSPHMRLLLFIGILGSYTTFSSFGYETFMLLRNNEIASAFMNVFLQVFFGLFAVWLGYILASWR